MLYAIISDIHSNLEAFTAVLQKIDSLDVDGIIALGDIVGYNANPNECIETIKERKIKSVMGNHDLRACYLKEPDNFTTNARKAVLWTRSVLKKENLEFLKTLPKTISLHDKKGTALHGSLTNTVNTYILSPWIALENFKILENNPALPPVCFFGHTHIRIAYQYIEKRVLTLHEKEILLDPRSLYLINPGSVGQPRDRDPRASFITYDTEKSLIVSYRVPYDIIICYEKIIKAGLPVELAERLKIGW